MGSTVKVMMSILARLLSLFVLFVSPAQAQAPSPQSKDWVKYLRKRLAEIDEAFSGHVGVYVKDLSTGEELSLRGEEPWYIASGVKVPIAIEVLRQIEKGKLALSTLVKLEEDDFVDGAGETNSRQPGSFVTVRFLMDQMLIHSDNTASDLLIRLVGLENINRLRTDVLPSGFTEITRLSDVRRLAFSGFHANAARLRNRDFIELKSIGDERLKIKRLENLLKIREGELKVRTLDAAFSSYYAQRINSASLVAYGRLLEELAEGKLLGPSSAKYLIETMARAETGKMRIKAGLPATAVFAHKTGTQHARICDFGIAWDKREPTKKFVIASCVRDISSLTESEAVMKEVGLAIHQSGLMTIPFEERTVLQ